ncbi:zinc finger CCCH domain-containing protein 22-like [Chenopodium quinoa]|uniref:zinc finger CCCH domain-containing protein 22-like n=1 Tax=Chenopodium quinoa TaxID=63459 RepID=UPI000B786E67|nr:zinc finger CCCH domain-containing protein 22-like [Chenopodium quinoa]
MANEEERLLETQLELQLHEQKDSLSAIQDALIFDSQNSELLSVQDELVSAIKDAEEGLFHLKRARLLREVDFATQGYECSNKDAEVEHIKPAELDTSKLPSEDVEAEPLHSSNVEVETLEEPSYFVGSKCRFRHTDGRWYNGQIVELDGSSARVSFLNPTSEKMMMCKFFLQQRCRFGANCRLSHGTLMSLSSLKKYVSPCWGQPLVGASIFAVSRSGASIWREAELESWDDKLNQGQIVFRDDGSSETLGAEAMALSQHAEASNDEEDRETDNSDSENSGSSDYEDVDDGFPQGLGFVKSTALQKGIQTDTAIFAKWENHTRGIASKMMANMGFREGMGLGLAGQGMVNPIPVKVLPAKQSLDHAMQSVKNEERDEHPEKNKKQSRGGKRKREKNFAEAARAAKQEEQRPDVFSLINSHLATHGRMINNESSVMKKKSKEVKKEDRRSMIAYEEEVKELRNRVEKLEEMANRNRKEKAVYEAAMRKLTETQKALSEAEAKHASTSNAVVSKEKEKKWLKF